jgi:hypothetical protein
MDLADQAQLQAAPLNTLERRKPEGPKPTGQCLNCDETLRPEHRWCDAECRDMWQQQQRQY